MQRRVPDISKITALTGYTPKISIDETLRLTCQWFREQRAAESIRPRAVSAAD
jgi:nucleoside-diphosphate-sugar epimerase